MLIKKNKRKQLLRVWDLPTRFYHWLQLLLVVGGLLSGFFAHEWWLNYHVYIGYALIALIVFRIVWGFFGSNYSRFSSFIFSPKILKKHISGVLHKKPLHYWGHNPLGALMVFALLAVLIGISISGLINFGGVENQGMLAGFVDYATGDIAGKLHLFLAFALIAMIFLHVLGVFIESRISKVSLTKAMISGDKPLEAEQKKPILQPAHLKLTFFLIVVLGVILIGGSALMNKKPASGFIKMPKLSEYYSECADCHEVYHPSLLPKTSWVKMMHGLGDHFGEDASLDDETTKIITQYLSDYSAQNWDSEAANNFRIVDENKPFQISATPYWKMRHAKINPQIFKTKPVNGQRNCSACHGDAKTGRFDDQQISIPKQDKKEK